MHKSCFLCTNELTLMKDYKGNSISDEDGKNIYARIRTTHTIRKFVKDRLTQLAKKHGVTESRVIEIAIMKLAEKDNDNYMM